MQGLNDRVSIRPIVLNRNISRGELLTELRYYDLSALPLVGILSRKDKSMVLLVSLAVNGEKKDVVVKLHLDETGLRADEIDISKLICYPKDAFSEELAILYSIQPKAFGNTGCNNVVRLLGWGMAQNCRGIVLEALRGPILHDQLYKSPEFVPDEHLELLFRLNWSSQLCNIVAQLHENRILHGDLRCENFGFRTAPSRRFFGRLTLFDFDRSMLMAKHPAELVRAKTTPYDYYEEFAENVYSAYLKGPEGTEYRTMCVLRDYTMAGVWCSHKAGRRIKRPARETKGGSCNGSDCSCQRVDCHVCACPVCECKEGRAEVSDLAQLVASCLQMNDFGGCMQQCPECEKRIPLSDEALNAWIKAVTAHLDSMIFARSGIVFAVNDVHPPSFSDVSVKTLLKLRLAWSSLGNKIAQQIFGLLHRTMSRNIMSRPTARELDESLARLAHALSRFMSRFATIPLKSDFLRYLPASPDTLASASTNEN